MLPRWLPSAAGSGGCQRSRLCALCGMLLCGVGGGWVSPALHGRPRVLLLCCCWVRAVRRKLGFDAALTWK